MTLEASTARVQYTTAGTTGPYAVPFYFLASSHLRVVYTTAAGVSTTLTLTTDYSVSGAGVPAGGSITTVASHTAGGKITITRNVPLTQLTDYVSGDRFPAESHEQALDKQMMAAQQMTEVLDRTLRLPVAATGISAELPSPSASMILAWNDDATALENVSVPLSADTLSGANVTFIAAAAGAVARTMLAKGRERISVMDCGAVGDGATDDSTAFNVAIAAVSALGGGTVVVPRPPVNYRWLSTVTMTDGVRLEGEGACNRWRSTKTPVLVDYRGSGSAITIAPGVGVGVDSAQIANLMVTGLNAASGCHGLYLVALGLNSYIEGVLVENCTFLNFPGNQIHHDGVVFDVTYSRVTSMNPGRAALDCVYITNTAALDGPSQVTFDDCWISPYTAGKWSINAQICQDLRLLGGTLAPYVLGTVGANGVLCAGGLTVLGTHIEGTDPTNTDAIGIQYLGANGGLIAPSNCSLFGTGVVIGDGTAAGASGYTIAGTIGNNNDADIIITNGGTRTGVILEIGVSNGTPTIIDNRRDLDGVYEVVLLRGGGFSNATILAAPGTESVPTLAFAAGSARGFYSTADGIGVTTGGGRQVEFRATDTRLRTKLLPGTPAGAFQTTGGISAGAGAPSDADGANGDFYLRSDGTVAGNTVMYHKEGGSWVAMTTT